MNCSQPNLEEFLQVQEISESFQFIIGSFPVDVSAFRERVGLRADLVRSIMVSVDEFIGETQHPIDLANA